MGNFDEKADELILANEFKLHEFSNPSILSSFIVITLFILFFNIFSQPKPTPEELLELELSSSNETAIVSSKDGGLADFILPPKLEYFQFLSSFSANMKNDSNIMNTEIALCSLIKS